MIPVLLDRLHVKVRAPFTRERVEGVVSACGGSLVGQMNGIRWVVVAIDHSQASDLFLAYERHPDVEAVDFKREPKPLAVASKYAATSDSLLDGMRALKRMGVLGAWRHTKGAGVALGIVDTGVTTDYATWPAFAGRTFTIIGTPWASTSALHGSYVAQVAAGNAGKTEGAAGIAPECDFVIADYQDEGGTEGGIVNCVDNGADVINVSVQVGVWSGPGETWAQQVGPEQDALRYARDHDVLVCASIGNDGVPDVVATPAAGCHALGHLGVGCVTPWEEQPDKPAMYTNHGPNPNLVTPGHHVWAHNPTTTARHVTPVAVPAGWSSPLGEAAADGANAVKFNYFPFEGTSSASPCACGVALLVRSKSRELATVGVPELSSVAVRDLILATVDKAQNEAFYRRFTRPGVGIPAAERAVLEVMARHSPGSVFPYLNVFGRGCVLRVEGGVATMHLRGAVEVEIDAFSTDPIGRVELRVGSGAAWDLVYSGAPRTTWTGLLPFAAARLVGKRFKLTVYTAAASSEEEYPDVVGYATSSVPPRTVLLTPPGKTGEVAFAVYGENPPFTTEASWDGGAWGTVTSPTPSRTGTLRLRSTDALGNREGG